MSDYLYGADTDYELQMEAMRARALDNYKTALLRKAETHQALLASMSLDADSDTQVLMAVADLRSIGIEIIHPLEERDCLVPAWEALKPEEAEAVNLILKRWPNGKPSTVRVSDWYGQIGAHLSASGLPNKSEKTIGRLIVKAHLNTWRPV